jgi:hypothetical protein
MVRRVLLTSALALLLTTPLFFPSQEARAGDRASRAAALAARLRAQRLQSATFDAIGLPELLKWLRVATGRNFVLDRAALARADIEPDEVTFTAQLEDVSVATLLRLALEPRGLAAVVRGNVVVVTTHAASLGKPVTRMYGIQHITWTKVDFIAPDINLRPSDYTPLEEYEPERVVEDDPLATGDAVAELLQELVARGEWDNEGWRISATDRYLVIRAPRTVHARIPAALAVIAGMK